MGMMRLRENNDAISSVISVALMIVVAAIIVAVIASLVLGVTSDIPDAKAVAVTARVSPLTEDPTSQYLVVTLYSDVGDTSVPTKTIGPAPTLTIGPGPTKTIGPAPTLTIGPGPTKTIGPAPTKTIDPRPSMTIDPRPSTTIGPIPSKTIGPEPIPPATTPVYLTLMVNGTYAGGTKDPSVGESFFSEFPVIPGDCHAIVVAKFKDGSEQIILNRHF